MRNTKSQSGFGCLYLLLDIAALVASIVGVIMLLTKNTDITICFWIVAAKMLATLFVHWHVVVANLLLTLIDATIIYFVLEKLSYWRCMEIGFVVSYLLLFILSSYFGNPSKVEAHILTIDREFLDIEELDFYIPDPEDNLTCTTQILKIGKDIPLDLYRENHEPFSRKLYLVIINDDGELKTAAFSKSQWKKYQSRFEKLGMI